jgi:hypothetical protein
VAGQQEHPESQIAFELSCLRKHIGNAVYECPLPPNQPMVLLFRDERKANDVLLTGIATVLSPNARPFHSSNDVM